MNQVSELILALKSSIDLNYYGEIDALIGRVWRPDTPQKDFAKGSGLDEKFSNLVGNIKYNITNNLKFDYSFSKDSQDLRSQRDTFSLDINIVSIFLKFKLYYGTRRSKSKF